MTRRAWLPSAALSLASIVVTLAVLEAAFRLVGVHVGTVQISRRTMRRSADPRLAFELKPNATARAEVPYRINSLGMRNPEIDEAKPPGVRRIAVLGDSLAFGYWVEEEDAFPRQLEAILNEGPPGRVEVLNFGVPGYNLEQELATLYARIGRFSPDAVILALCLNDLRSIFSHEYGLVMDRSARMQSSLAGRASEWLLERSLLLSWVEYRRVGLEARRGFVRAKNPLGASLYRRALEEQRAELDSRFAAFSAWLRANGDLPGLVVVFPTFGNRFENYPHRPLHAAIATAAEGAGLASLDLVDCFEAYDYREVRVDVIHPNPMGHRIAAHAIAQALCEGGLLCEGSRRSLERRCTGYRPSEFRAVRGY